MKELVTGVIWNMSSCEDLKQCIIEEGAHVIVSQVIIPHSGWHATSPGETYWSTGKKFTPFFFFLSFYSISIECGSIFSLS